MFSRAEALPDPSLSVRQWAEKWIGKKAASYLLDPILGGIYAARIEDLNARVILKRFFSPPEVTHPQRGKRKKGILSVAPRGGMNELAQKLRSYLEKQGVRFELGIDQSFSVGEGMTVFCGSLADAQEYFKSYSKFRNFFDLEMLPVTTTTQFYEKDLGYRAFGILYPRSEKRAFLGTLLNHQVFPERYTKTSETWIKAELLADLQARDLIAKERAELFKDSNKPLASLVTGWPKALPLYDSKLEVFLRETWPSMSEELKKSGIYVHGNYLGKLGLSQLLIRSKELAQGLAGA